MIVSVRQKGSLPSIAFSQASDSRGQCFQKINCFSHDRLSNPILNSSQKQFIPTRRNLLQALPLVTFLTITPSPSLAAGLSPLRVAIPAGDEIPPQPRQYFCDAVETIASQIGADFKARLTIYGFTPNLPSGVPGDPAKDFKSSGLGGKGQCGKFLPLLPEGRPYALCPLLGDTPLDELSRECCRHFAFAVPYSKFGFAVEDRITTIVVSPRLFLLPEKRWQAILAHELGHAVDFYLYGKRYLLTNHPVAAKSASEDLLNQLESIDQRESDPELRADALGELLVLTPRNQKLCYDPLLTLQTLVDPSEACQGDGNGPELMRHYTHAPLQGILKP